MTSSPNITPHPEWKKKASAFLVRSRQELWGKHNEDILAWFFREGFSNRFIQDMLLGWNRHAQVRPAQNWGLPEEVAAQGIRHDKLILPAGIVIPHIVNQNLRKLLIYDIGSTSPNRCTAIPGGSSEPIILGENRAFVAIVSNIIHALFVHQELRNQGTVIVPHQEGEAITMELDRLIISSETVWIFPDPFSDKSKHEWIGYPNVTRITYERSDDIVKLISHHCKHEK